MMQPTMKFRLLRTYSYVKGEPFLTDSYGYYYRLQQWWEGKQISSYLGYPRYKDVGEWRDIPIEVEE